MRLGSARWRGGRFTSRSWQHTKKTIKSQTLNLTQETRQRLFGGAGVLSLVSESGLYKLVMRSDKKEAKQFQEWVTREVLPSIRKTGTYTMPGA